MSPIPSSRKQACLGCRKDKRRCGGERPSCDACTRLHHQCEYPKTRLKPGPKTNSRASQHSQAPAMETDTRLSEEQPCFERTFSVDNFEMFDFTEAVSSTGSQPLEIALRNKDTDAVKLESNELDLTQTQMSLLDNTFFADHGRYVPLLHPEKYFQRCRLVEQFQPPRVLRYAIWAMAAFRVQDSYLASKRDSFYKAAKHLAMQWMQEKGPCYPTPPVVLNTMELCQSLVLLSQFEFMTCLFEQAWDTTGILARLCLRLGVHNIDAKGEDLIVCDEKQDLNAFDTPIEREEKRRLFWFAFQSDRTASCATGAPMTIDLEDVFTNLPCPDDEFIQGAPVHSVPFKIHDDYTAEEIQSLDYGGFISRCLVVLGRILRLTRQPARSYYANFVTGYQHHRAALEELGENRRYDLKAPRCYQDMRNVLASNCYHMASLSLEQAKLNFLYRTNVKDKRAFKETEDAIHQHCSAMVNSIMGTTRVEYGDLWGLHAWTFSSALLVLHGLNSSNYNNPSLAHEISLLTLAMKSIGSRYPISLALFSTCERAANAIPGWHHSVPEFPHTLHIKEKDALMRNEQQSSSESTISTPLFDSLFDSFTTTAPATGQGNKEPLVEVEVNSIDEYPSVVPF